MNVLGLIIDLIFLTNMYNRKYKIKNYSLMIVLMFISSVFLQSNLCIQVLVDMCIVFCFTCNILSLHMFSLSFILMMLLEVFVLEVINIQNAKFLFVCIIKLLFIVIINKELSEFVIKIHFKNITLKVLYVVFVFLCFAGSMYIVNN